MKYVLYLFRYQSQQIKGNTRKKNRQHHPIKNMFYLYSLILLSDYIS